MEKIKLVKERGITFYLFDESAMYDLSDLVNRLQNFIADGYTDIDIYLSDGGGYVEAIPTKCVIESDEEFGERKHKEKERIERIRQGNIEDLARRAKYLGFDLVSLNKIDEVE